MINISDLLVSSLFHCFSHHHICSLSTCSVHHLTRCCRLSQLFSILFIIQVIIDDFSPCFIPRLITAGGDELALLAKGGEGVMDIKLTATAGSQGTEGRWSPRDVDIVLVVRWRMTM